MYANAAPFSAGRCRRISKPVREHGNDGVVGECGVAMPAGFNVRHAAAAVALNGPRTVDADGVTPEAVHDSRVDRDDVSGPAEAVAVSERVAHRNAFHAPTETEGQMPNSRNSVGEAAAVQILVRHGHHLLARL